MTVLRVSYLWIKYARLYRNGLSNIDRRQNGVTEIVALVLLSCSRHEVWRAKFIGENISLKAHFISPSCSVCVFIARGKRGQCDWRLSVAIDKCITSFSTGKLRNQTAYFVTVCMQVFMRDTLLSSRTYSMWMKKREENNFAQLNSQSVTLVSFFSRLVLREIQMSTCRADRLWTIHCLDHTIISCQ